MVLPERIDLLELYSGRGSLRQIVLGVRIDEQGQIRPVSAPLGRMVHIGAAGATDSGKSNFGRVVAVQVATAVEDVVLVFVDEVTNLFMNKETQRLTLALIRESRAFGIHFITLGQSWSHKEMDVSFREQHRTTGHFGTNNPHSSRMMINKPDAVQITVPGRAYFSLPFEMSKDVVEIQTPYIDPETALRLLPSGKVPPTPPPASSSIVGPTETEARVLAGWDAGERRLSIIAEAVYRNKGGKQVELVREILRRWGRLTEEWTRCTGVPGVPPE